jgi:hypothetical protein
MYAVSCLLVVEWRQMNWLLNSSAAMILLSRDGLETETSRSRDVSRRIQGLVSISSRNICYRLGLVSVSRLKVSDLVSVSAA